MNQIMMAAKTICENLNQLRKRIREADLHGNDFQTGNFLVLSLHRHLSDPKHRAQIGAGADQSTVVDVIVLTVGDGVHKLKLLLAPGLNKLVQTCKIRVGCTVVLKKCKVQYDETNIKSGKLIIVEQLEVTGCKEIQDQTELSRLQWAEDCSHIEQLDIPLTSMRGYYVTLWSTMQMYGQTWKTTAPVPSDLGSIAEQDIYRIKDLAKDSGIKSTNPIIVVRVLCKSRMLHYSKPNKNDKWPFQVTENPHPARFIRWTFLPLNLKQSIDNDCFGEVTRFNIDDKLKTGDLVSEPTFMPLHDAHILVGDETGACVAVLWNDLCPNMYHGIKEGTVLLLRKFRSKPSFHIQQRFRSVAKDIGLKIYDLDINLNSSHPESEVKVIDEEQLPDSIVLPPLHHNFVSRRQAGSFGTNFICGIAGMVTFVGRYERELMYNKFGVDSGGYWIRRWVRLQDGSSNRPFWVQLYKIAEGMSELDIKPGMLLVCTNMRLINNFDLVTSSVSQRDCFVTTTAESQISMLDERLYDQLQGIPAISELWKWSRTERCAQLLGEARVGGYVQFPPMPDSVDKLKKCFKDWQIVASNDWERVLTGFSYREMRQLTVQATLVHITVNFGRLATQSKSGSPSKKMRHGVCEITLDKTVQDNAQSMMHIGQVQLDKDVSFPVQYRAKQWSALRDMLQFPATELQSSQPGTSGCSALDFETVPYLTVTWAGLNTKVLLQTHAILPELLPENCSLLDLFKGVIVPRHSPGPSQKTSFVPISETLVLRMVQTATVCAEKRFLLVIDCYQGSTQNLEIMLNRAIEV